MKPILALFVCAMFGAPSAFGQTASPQTAITPTTENLAIDGVFDEWNQEFVVATDAKSDSLGVFDISKVAARTAGATLFLHFDIGSTVNLQNGPEAEGKLVLDLNLGSHGTLLVDFRGRAAVLNQGDLITPVPWPKIDFACLPTFAASEYELKIDLTALGVSSGEQIQLNFSGSDELDKPVAIKLAKLDLERSQFSLNDVGQSSFRIANLNTWRNGLADPSRSQSILRILESSGAKIWTFQEEFDEIKFRNASDKLFGPNFNSIWSSGCAIVTDGLELQQIPMDLDRAVAGLVTISPNRQLLLVAAHFKCCGFAGTQEDKLRAQQAKQVASAIDALRQGQFGDLAKNAPIVVIGDYNLVGTREPVDILGAAGLTALRVRAPGDGSAYTWREIKKDLPQSFWPSRLDWVMHDSGLTPLKGLIVDTTRMSSDELTAQKLSSEDSLASDHLAIITEFEFSR